MQCYVLRRPSGGEWEFLQLRRSPAEFMGGTWQTISGKIEPGETAPQAALRELLEETALHPLEFFQLDTVNTFYLAADDAIWMCPAFCAIVDPNALVHLNDEHDGSRWLPRDAYLREVMWPGERTALAELCREILDHGPARRHLRLSLPLQPIKELT